MKYSLKNTYIFLALLIILGVASRLLPHVWDTTPITALALFVSVYFGLEYSIFFVMAAMFISDSIIGFYSLPIMISVYGSLFIAGALGQYVRKNKNTISLFLVTFSSSALFFIVTNWAVWQFGTMYAHSWQGLVQCYTMAIPFFRNSLVGDLFYTGAFFGSYELSLATFRKFIRARKSRLYQSQ